MGRSPCCDKMGLKKGPWTSDEDRKLLAHIQQHGHGNWHALPSKAGLRRCGKSCRLRWANYLRPDIKRGKFTSHEDDTIIQLHALLGNRWSTIAAHLPKRTDNEIKNYWNTHLKKRLAKMGIDPATHKPKSQQALAPSTSSSCAANISHMAQWESARLQAEARSKSTAGSAQPAPPPWAWAWADPGKDISAVPAPFYDLAGGVMGNSAGIHLHDHVLINPNDDDHHHCTDQYCDPSLGFEGFWGGVLEADHHTQMLW